MCVCVRVGGGVENDRRNDFVINLHESYGIELGFELATPGSAVRWDTGCTIDPGLHVHNMSNYPANTQCHFDVNTMLHRHWCDDIGATLQRRWCDLFQHHMPAAWVPSFARYITRIID